MSIRIVVTTTVSGKGRGNLLALLVWSIHTLSLSYSGWFCIKSLYMAVLDWIIWISRNSNRIFVQMCFWCTVNGEKNSGQYQSTFLDRLLYPFDWPNLLIAELCVATTPSESMLLTTVHGSHCSSLMSLCFPSPYLICVTVVPQLDCRCHCWE